MKMMKGRELLESKKCGKCEKEKPLTEYSRHKKSPDGVQGWCKQCHSENLSEWRKANAILHKRSRDKWKAKSRDRIKAYQAAYYKNNKEQILARRKERKARVKKEGIKE